MCLGPARSTSWPPVLFLQPLVHLQLHAEGLQELVVLGEQLLPQLRLLLNPGKAPRPQGGDVNSDARGWTLTPQSSPSTCSSRQSADETDGVGQDSQQDPSPPRTTRAWPCPCAIHPMPSSPPPEGHVLSALQRAEPRKRSVLRYGLARGAELGRDPHRVTARQ